MSRVKWYNVLATSNNTPSPIEIKASSEHSDTHKAFMAFNGVFVENNATVNTWASVVNQQNGSWIQINYGEPKKVNKLELTTRVSNSLAQTPTRFKILGSNDEVEWEELGYFHVPSWMAQTSYEFDLKESEYQIYRVHNIVSTSHASWVQIRYGYEECTVRSYFEYEGRKVILDKKEIIKLPNNGYEKYYYNDCDRNKVEWSDVIEREVDVLNIPNSGRVEYRLPNVNRKHRIRGK